MFEILLLLAAAFSGHEVVANVDADAQTPPAVVESVDQTPAAAPKAAMILVAEKSPPAQSESSAQNSQKQNESPAQNDPETAAAIDRVSDFYDTTPPATPTAEKPTAEKPQRQAKPRAVPAVSPAAAIQPRQKRTAARSALGPGLVGTTESYVSKGKRVVIEVLRPDDDSHRPAVLILHGASGIGDGAFYRSAAENFAERGYVTFLPHYLAATQSPRVRAAVAHGKRPPEGSIRAGFPQQEQVLRDAVDYMAANPYVDSTRIGVFGLSLGGFHALTLSSTDGRIGAVVDMSGALPGNVAPESNHLPPVLELHGAHDPIVPVVRTRETAATLNHMGVPHEVKIYPDQGHFFHGKAQQDAFQRATAFFSEYLKPSESNHASRSTKTDIE